MSLSAYSSSIASSSQRRQVKYDEKFTDYAAPDSSCFIDDIVRLHDNNHQAVDDFTDNTNMDSNAIRKLKNKEAAMKSRQKKKSESD